MPTHKSSDYKLSAVKYYNIIFFGIYNYTFINYKIMISNK